MPLLPGHQNIRANIQELQTGEMSASRRKAIRTYARKHGLSFKEAKFRMSTIIAASKANEPSKGFKKHSKYAVIL